KNVSRCSSEKLFMDFRQLASDDNLAVRPKCGDSIFQSFSNPMRRLIKNFGLRRLQNLLKLPPHCTALGRQKSPKGKRVEREAAGHESGNQGCRTGKRYYGEPSFNCQ